MNQVYSPVCDPIPHYRRSNRSPCTVGNIAIKLPKEPEPKPAPLPQLALDMGIMSGKIVKIAITGGPCAGKTTLMAKAVQELESRGVKVFIVPEAATTLISGMHITPGDFGMIGFQSHILNNQFAMEHVVETAAAELMEHGFQTVILCDRGKLDGLAYADAAAIEALLAEHGSNLVEARDSYDAVIHMVTAANGAEEAYTLSNNAARSETPEQARELDTKTLKAWTGHPHLSIIGNTGTFQEKIAVAIKVIYDCLGIPAPVERERKFLALMPDLESLGKYNPVASQIVQTYLPDIGNTERRVRQRGDGTNFSFFYTEKTDLDGVTDRIERESMITPRQYASFLAQVDYGKITPIHKTRHCFPYQDQYLELDVYAGEERYVTIEVEGLRKDSAVSFPPEITVVKEITGDKRFSNRAIAGNSGHLPEEALGG